MSNLHAKIQQAASQNAQLLQGLSETDAAASQLAQQNAYITDLVSQISSTTKRVNDLKRKTALELKDHEKYRDSTIRRFAHKASGRKDRFSEKAAKEEKEYFDAIQSQKSAEDQLNYLTQLNAQAEVQKLRFESEAQRHQHLQASLDALYNSIFAGPTPEFPNEDQKEYACTSASQQVQNLNHQLSHEHHVLFLLGQTSSKLSEVRNTLDSAYGMSQYDMFGGGQMASMQKRNYLERAESSIQQVRMLQSQIQQVAPDIPDIGRIVIDIGSIWSDVVFDNIFSDMQMHDQIKEGMAHVDQAGHRCGEIIKGRELVVGRLEGDVKRAQEDLREKRMELQKAREHAFTRVTGDASGGVGIGTDAPPAYAM
ncbi:hypothetical protein T440DRAFT_466705 [Plenodomus tracheiphilus IPT5]|uniref:Uncharacterized protein n=1 Tax=Plenodomus tracheiphilus IPT5 TaxID=1408161 RepID=A0A6A7BAL1_9PLEO|nr:hypothetical protein T440DRAFT_466705 [Plenodomus tracheiphilus IPT5]